VWSRLAEAIIRPVRAEDHTLDLIVMALHRLAMRRTRGRVPPPHRPVLARRGDHPPVRAERHRLDLVGVAG
jgi:hypothetical protein